jgi:ABC-2 type transport system ATP-binding protein
MSAALSVRGLKKTFHIGFFRKRVAAVRDVSFEVGVGETFGLLGPNGAGKTTSIKIALGLVKEDAGQVALFGAARSRAAMVRLGYAPESPYLYQYLRAPEFLDLCGRLVGMDARRRRARIAEMLALFDLESAADRPIGRFSKGMMQRVGLAQALLHDPELLILDEPMSGLDPIGRKQVRDIILAERKAGKTIVFTSHVLSDVELLCDHIAIVQRGEVVSRGRLSDLLKPDVRRVRVRLSQVSAELAALLPGDGLREGADLVLRLEGDANVGPLLGLALGHGAQVLAVEPERETLEELVLRRALAVGEDAHSP